MEKLERISHTTWNDTHTYIQRFLNLEFIPAGFEFDDDVAGNARDT